MAGLLSLATKFGDTSVENLRRLGFLQPGTEASERNVKSAITKYNKSLENPAVRRREVLRRDGQDKFTDADLGNRKIITPEDMLGNTLVPVFGDRTVTGRTIESIQGIDLPTPQNSDGGVNFIRRYQDTPLAYASMLDQASKKQGNFDFAAERTDNPNVLGVYTASADPANNFTNPTAGSLFQMTQSLQLPKKAKKQFDDDMRKKDPNWVGLDSPDAYDQLMGLGKYPMEGAGARRIKFTETMDSAKYRDLGFPVRPDVMNTIIEPDLVNVNRGDSGYGVFKADVGANVVPMEGHGAYNTGILGQYEGGLEVSRPASVMFPDAFKWMQAQGRGESGQLGSLMMDPKLFQIADDKWINRVNHYDKTGEILPSRPEAGVMAAMVAADSQGSGDPMDYLRDEAVARHNAVVDQKMQTLGMDPQPQQGYEYGDLLPYRRNIETGEREMAMPSFARDAIRGLLDLSSTPKTKVYNPQSIFDVMM